MLKFIHKKHINQQAKSKFRFVIYYSASDIVLGILLIALTSFFIYNYLQANNYSPEPNYTQTQSSDSNAYILSASSTEQIKK